MTDEIMESVSNDDVEMVSSISSGGKIHDELVGAASKTTLEAVTPRFQLFSASVHVDVYHNKKFSLFGWITVSDPCVSSRDNGWVQHDDPDSGHSVLFFRDWDDPLSIINHASISDIKHPKTHSSVPVCEFIDINTDLHVFNMDDDLFLQVSNQYARLNDITCDKFLSHTLSGDDGSLELVYIVLTDPVDATVDITFKDNPPDNPDDFYTNPVSLTLTAYYGGHNDCGCSSLGKGYFNLTLLNEDSVTMSDNKKITLNTSVVAVPANGSLVIDAYLMDSTGCVVMMDVAEFHAKHKGSSSARIKGAGFSLEVNVNWKYEAAT